MQNYKDLFILPWKVTIDSRLRWLQYKINHVILPTNKWLHKIGIIDSPNCLRCKTNIETMSHIFIECPDVMEFWHSFQRKWNGLFDGISDIEKLFGILDSDIDDWQMKNQLLLIARRYICNCRYNGSPLSVRVFDILLRDTARLEETLASQRDKLEIHFQKWANAGIYT